MARTAEQVKAKVCGKKVPYPGSQAARQMAKRLNRDERTSPYSAYRCPVCHKWHVGHVPSMESVQEIADMIRGRLPAEGDSGA